jgi:hypothetical protein
MAAAEHAAYRAAMARALLVLLAAACTTVPQWHKEGATKEGTAADLQACQVQAPVEPRRQGTLGMPSGAGGERRAAFNTMAEREGERMQKDQRFVADCMREKGYTSE